MSLFANFHRLSTAQTPLLQVKNGVAVLSGDWTLAALHEGVAPLREQLLRARGQVQEWDLSVVRRLDAFGALLLWQAWGLREPDRLILPAHMRAAFARIKDAAQVPITPARFDWLQPIAGIGYKLFGFYHHVLDVLAMLGNLVIEAVLLLRYPGDIAWREISAAVYKGGVQAMPIAALLGFLIGVVLSYLSALQLQNFGAEQFLINILGLGIIRELGPMLVSVLVAGRSGSAITAQLGVMRVTEEIDALATMGVSRYQRLVLPKIIGLCIAMPFLVLWTSAAALVGGMAAAHFQINLDYRYFLEALPTVVQMANLYIGLAKGVVFGMAIALISCHFGLRVKPNTESLSRNTTASVVASITAVIVLDALFAIATRTIGVVVR